MQRGVRRAAAIRRVLLLKKTSRLDYERRRYAQYNEENFKAKVRRRLQLMENNTMLHFINDNDRCYMHFTFILNTQLLSIGSDYHGLQLRREQHEDSVNEVHQSLL